MSKFEQLRTRYLTARQHVESCVKKLQQVLEHLRSDWEWPQQEYKNTKHISYNLRYESRATTPGHSEIFGHPAFTMDTAGGVHTVLSATVSEEHMQSPLSVRLSIAMAGGEGKAKRFENVKAESPRPPKVTEHRLCDPPTLL